MTPEGVGSLMKQAIAYVSLHRSEGYGLTCAEAMALGTPVIATGYSGNLDFMNDDNSFLVDYDLIPVKDSTGTYEVDARWADPKIDSAIEKMRKVYLDKKLASKVGQAGQESIRAAINLGTASEFVKTRLSEIYSEIQRRAEHELAEKTLAAEHQKKLAEEEQTAQLLAAQREEDLVFPRKIASLVPLRLRNWIREVIEGIPEKK
jgi:hypothetical protein